MIKMIKNLLKNIFIPLLTRIQALEYSMGLIADYVVETGTDGIWTYEKWESGKAVCWGETNFTIDITTGQGTIYLSQPTTVSLPSNFLTSVKSFSVQKNSYSSNSGIFNSAYDSSVNGITFSVFRGNSGNSNVIQVVLEVIGTWK